MTDAHPRAPLDAEALRGPAAWRARVLQECASTNAELGARARAGEEEGLVVVAEHQRDGRGRLGRSWVAPSGTALTFSVLLRPPLPERRWPWLPLLAGVAVCEGVEAAGGPPCALKWPNDVLLQGRKVGGILAERVETARGAAAVLGIGVNVAQDQDELPVPGATSLALAGAQLDRTKLLGALLSRLHERYAAWSGAQGTPGPLEEAYRARCATVGSQVRVQLPDGTALVGDAVGIGADGGLVVATATGRRTVSAGDVVHVRPPASGG